MVVWYSNVSEPKTKKKHILICDSLYRQCASILRVYLLIILSGFYLDLTGSNHINVWVTGCVISRRFNKCYTSAIFFWFHLDSSGFVSFKTDFYLEKAELYLFGQVCYGFEILES